MLLCRPIYSAPALGTALEAHTWSVPWEPLHFPTHFAHLHASLLEHTCVPMPVLWEMPVFRGSPHSVASPLSYPEVGTP